MAIFRLQDSLWLQKILQNNILWKFVWYFAKKYGHTTLYGFGLYDRPLLASYSRSGTNLCRYIIEYITKQPTPGQLRLIHGTNYYTDRAHCAYPIMHKYGQVVLLVRDYRECLLRHHKNFWLKCRDTEHFLTSQKLEQPPSWYINNIQAFDAFPNRKLLIYYEELIQTPQSAIKKLCSFLGLEKRGTEEFIKNLDYHFQKSVEAYCKGGHISASMRNKDLKFHAKKYLTRQQEEDFDHFYFQHYPVLAEKYLTRYDTRQSLCTEEETGKQ